METNSTLKNYSQTPSKEDIEKECHRRDLFFWNWLIWSLTYYVGVNLALLAINWYTSPNYWWAFWVIGGWGISLLMTAIEKSIKH